MAVRYHVLEARDNIRQKVLFIVFAIFVIFMANTFVVCVLSVNMENIILFSKVYANLGGKIISPNTRFWSKYLRHVWTQKNGL